MATKTTNYGLAKPDQTEYYDVDIFNDNADIIDTAIKNAEGAVQEAVDLVQEGMEAIVRATTAIANVEEIIERWSETDVGDFDSKITAVKALIDGTAIVSGADLNSFTTCGNYYCNTTAICNSLSNCPVTTRVFSLEVLTSSSTSSRRIQRLTAHYTTNSSSYGAGKPTIWERAKYSASAWSDWVQVYTSNDAANTAITLTAASGFTLTSTSLNKATYNPITKQVTINIHVTGAIAEPAHTTIATIPAAYAPTGTVVVAGSAGTEGWVQLQLTSDGYIQQWRPTGNSNSNASARGTFVYYLS